MKYTKTLQKNNIQSFYREIMLTQTIFPQIYKYGPILSAWFCAHLIILQVQYFSTINITSFFFTFILTELTNRLIYEAAAEMVTFNKFILLYGNYCFLF